VATSEGEDGGLSAAAERQASPGNGNGYALTDVIDDLMAAEFPETTAPQADSEEVVLLSPTPPTMPPPPPPSAEDVEPEEDAPEVVEGNGNWAENGERVAAGHPAAAHESRVTLSGPLQFMGRNDLPPLRGGDELVPPEQSPVSSPVKLLDVLPATLRDAAAAEASLARAVPLTSGSIDAVSLDDTLSPWRAVATASHVETSRADDERDVFNEPSTTAVDVVASEDVVDKDEVIKTDVVNPAAAETTVVTETSAVVVAAAAESSDGVSLHRDRTSAA